MNIELVEKVIPEIELAIVGLRFQKIYQLGENRFAIAFEGDEFRLLFISIRPRDPRIYLIRRRVRDLKKLTSHPSQFSIFAERSLSGAIVDTVNQITNERVVEIEFGDSSNIAHTFVIQLTGTSSNCFLLDAHRSVLSTARTPVGEGQEIGSKYKPLDNVRATGKSSTQQSIELNEDTSPSESLDAYYSILDPQAEFKSLVSNARNRTTQALAQTRRLIKNLETDLAQHGDPELWKRFGDLLLANQATATRKAGSIIVNDLFDDMAPLIEIEAEENDSITEAAQKYFRKYSRARNAERSISELIEKANVELGTRLAKHQEVEDAIERHETAFLLEFTRGTQRTVQKQEKRNPATSLPGIRSYISSDGFEILVGKKAADNDRLTLRIAHSRDTWMHAADYPGSHVVIRNANRKEIPQRTLVEAAQIAAFFSQGNKQPKAAVNYTLKKHVSKPKRSPPGLVRLASFKTILVSPIFPDINSA